MAGGVAMLLVAGACSNRGGPQTEAKVPLGGASSSTSGPTNSSTSTTVAEVSYEVPEVIDQAYVQRVVSAYDKVLGEAIRILKRDGAVREDFLEHLLAIYTEEEFGVQQRAWLEAMAGGRATKMPDSPGDPVTVVRAVIEGNSGCVIARSDTDLSRTLNVPPEESPQDDYVVLVPKKAGRDPRKFNPTPWVISFDGAKTDNSVPRNSCGD